VKDKQAKGHVKCTMLSGSSGNFIASQHTTCNGQRETYNVATANATVAAKYFYLYFIASDRAAAIYLPGSLDHSADVFCPQARRNQPTSFSPFLLRSSLSAQNPFGRLAVYVFSFILSPQRQVGFNSIDDDDDDNDDDDAVAPHALTINSSSWRREGEEDEQSGCCINYDLVDFYDKTIKKTHYIYGDVAMNALQLRFQFKM